MDRRTFIATLSSSAALAAVGLRFAPLVEVWQYMIGIKKPKFCGGEDFGVVRLDPFDDVSEPDYTGHEQCVCARCRMAIEVLERKAAHTGPLIYLP